MLEEPPRSPAGVGVSWSPPPLAAYQAARVLPRPAYQAYSVDTDCWIRAQRGACLLQLSARQEYPAPPRGLGVSLGVSAVVLNTSERNIELVSNWKS